MDQVRVLVVVGTRPEAIKMIPVIRALELSKKFRPVVIGTGQHTDLVHDLFDSFGLKMDAILHASARIDETPPTLNEMVAKIITGVDRIWRNQGVPDDLRHGGRRDPRGAVACLVHGDTSSALAAAIAAFNLQIPIVHVEAGLRTSDILAPFPEEGNRQLISRLAAIHFSPTSTNKMNLVREGVDYDRIVITGNTSIDMLRWATERPGGFGPGLEELPSDGSAPIVLITAHRRENWGAGLDRISDAVGRLAAAHPQTQFVVPMHPNPVARAPFTSKLGDVKNVWLVEPREYASFARLMLAAKLVISDSGGVQEEAPALGTPVLVVRDTTERGEGVDAGTLTLVGTDIDRIVAEATRLLADPVLLEQRSGLRNPYGDGRASERIVEAMAHVFLDGPAPSFAEPNDALRRAVRRRLGLLEDGAA